MATPRIYKTEAIILRQRRLGEADRIVTLYSPNQGKLDAKAKGVRKTTSRMAGHLQPLTRCTLQLVQGRTMEVVAGCQAIEAFPAFRDDLQRLSRGLYAAELMDRILPERVEDPATYQLLLDTLRWLALVANVDSALRYFEMQLLGQAGFSPELGQCLSCASPLQPVANHFSPGAGGVLCPRCGGGNLDARPLSVNALKVLRLLQRGSWDDMAKLGLSADLREEVERHLRAYIVYVLERDVNAAAFIERLRREELGKSLKA